MLRTHKRYNRAFRVFEPEGGAPESLRTGTELASAQVYGIPWCHLSELCSGATETLGKQNQVNWPPPMTRWQSNGDDKQANRWSQYQVVDEHQDPRAPAESECPGSSFGPGHSEACVKALALSQGIASTDGLTCSEHQLLIMEFGRDSPHHLPSCVSW